jgi:hypothetical protein
MSLFHVTLSGAEPTEELRRAFAEAPAKLARARSRAARKLKTVVQRRILQALAADTGIPQARFKAMQRLHVRELGERAADGLSFWIGTNAIPAHRLGNVRWTRRMQGARVGRRSFPGTWSHPAPAKTAPAVMQRIGRFGRNGNPRLEMIDRVDVEIRTAAEAAITRMTPEIQERYTVLLTQEINYAFNLERGAA